MKRIEGTLSKLKLQFTESLDQKKYYNYLIFTIITIITINNHEDAIGSQNELTTSFI